MKIILNIKINKTLILKKTKSWNLICWFLYCCNFLSLRLTFHCSFSLLFLLLYAPQGCWLFFTAFRLSFFFFYFCTAVAICGSFLIFGCNWLFIPFPPCSCLFPCPLRIQLICFLFFFSFLFLFSFLLPYKIN